MVNNPARAARFRCRSGSRFNFDVRAEEAAEAFKNARGVDSF
jgi:hypothetical protein